MVTLELVAMKVRSIQWACIFIQYASISIYLWLISLLSTANFQRIKAEVDNEGIPSRTLREIAVLKRLKHENVVK